MSAAEPSLLPDKLGSRCTHTAHHGQLVVRGKKTQVKPEKPHQPTDRGMEGTLQWALSMVLGAQPHSHWPKVRKMPALRLQAQLEVVPWTHPPPQEDPSPSPSARKDQKVLEEQSYSPSPSSSSSSSSKHIPRNTLLENVSESQDPLGNHLKLVLLEDDLSPINDPVN